ncbi:thioredoxin domain-containing protein [Streptomyces sp. Q6]|uniref:Thioredoxin domain-containing protein n=1 Tax=Streptomyces citrinus TaxID=3118173 RepID=A0ACD5AC55_9ACTN
MRARARRAAVSAASTVLVGVLATAGCGRSGLTGGDDKDAARAHGATAYTKVAALPERMSADGTTVVVGSPDAETVVHVYEDMRCPVCQEFEREGGGEALQKLALTGEVRLEYTFASFLSDKSHLGGSGSRKAANALRAAVDRGKFTELHKLLFLHQPEEVVDGYTDAFLLRTASQVDGLRGKKFDAAVRTMKYGDFVEASQKAFDDDGADGTPGFAINGNLVPEHLRGGMFDAELLPLVVRMLAGGVTPPPDQVG